MFITVVLVHCSALKDSYRNKKMKEWNTQKIGERHRKNKKRKKLTINFMDDRCRKRARKGKK